MTKRLQVHLDDAELREIHRIARGQHLTTAERVRRSLRIARDTDTASNPVRRLESVAAAAGYSFPTGDVDVLLREIERGYLEDGSTDVLT